MVQEFAPTPRWRSKKNRRDPSRGVFAQLLSKIVKSNALTREVGVVAWPDPPFSSPSPLFTQCYRRGPFWPAYGAIARSHLQVRAPTCNGPMAAPPQRRGPALTPVDAVLRGLPVCEDS